jgi:hypothetical protein
MSSGCPATGFPVATALAWVPLLSAPLSGHRILYKALFPLDRHIRGICPQLASDPFMEEGLLGAVSAVGGGRASLASLRSPAYVTLVGTLQPLIKRWLKVSSSSSAWSFGGEDLSRMLAQPVLRSKPAFSAGCHGERGTLADKLLCPWPTQIIIPMTLTPETGEVSWDSMGLWRVLFLAEVYSHPSKSQGFSSDWKFVELEVKFHGVSPAVSTRASSQTKLA